jgi:large subunit ribosomal protein L9
VSTKVILRSDLANVGKRGDICEVADGYARNYLLPRGLALKATDGAVAQAQAMRRKRDLRDAADRSAAETIAARLVATTIAIKARAGSEGRLFGSVTHGDVVAAIAAQTGVELDKRHIIGDPIKTTGEHSVTVKLHSDVQFPVRLEVSGG